MVALYNRLFATIIYIAVKFFGTLSSACVMPLTFIILPGYAESTSATIDEGEVVYDDSTQSDSIDTKSQTPQKEQANRTSPTIAEVNDNQIETLASATSSPSPIWLEVNTKKVLGFWQEELSGSPKGAVLILPRPGNLPLETSLMTELQSYLPQYGWATLALSLPEPPKIRIPDRQIGTFPLAATADTATQEANAANMVDETEVVFNDNLANLTATSNGQTPETTSFKPEITWEEYKNQIDNIINAGMVKLNELGQYNIVLLGEGFGAYLSLSYLHNDSVTKPTVKNIEKKNQKAVIERPFRALLMLNIEVPPDQPTDTNLLSLGDIPTLDIFSNHTGYLRQTGKNRKQTAVKNQYEIYVQKKLPPYPLNISEEKTAKTIRGFLMNYAEGVTMGEN